MADSDDVAHFHILGPRDLHRRYQVVTFRQKQLGDNQASISRNGVRALESFIDKLEREVEQMEKRAKG